MFSFEQPISQKLDELKEEVDKYKKLTSNKNLKELTETEQILFCQNRQQLCKSYNKLAIYCFEQEDYENAAVYFHEGSHIGSVINIHWAKSEKALEFYRGLASKGNAFAQYHLGFMYHDGHGVSCDFNEAVKWFQLSAEQGNAFAQYNLGVMYYHGRGVSQDFNEAAKWWRLSAEQGYSNAQYVLGAMYFKGEGVPQDFKKALKWYRLSAEQGHDYAQYYLWSMYHHGQGVSQDLKESVKWCRFSAEQGNANAQYNLGLIYNYGQGVFQDFKEAVKWYRLSAEQGVVDAQVNLGFMYYHGTGVSQDFNEAVKLYRLSAEQGNDYAQEYFTSNKDSSSPIKQYHYEMLSTPLQYGKICEHLLQYEEVWEAFEFDVKRATYQSKLFENIESMKKYFLALSSSSLKFKSWQIEKLNALHLHFFKFYQDRLNEASDEERGALDNKKYESFNAINCRYINDAEDINTLITISTCDFLLFKGQSSEERAKIQNQLCEKFEKLILVAKLGDLNVKWGGVATILINELLQAEDIVYTRIVDLNIDQMMILNSLWYQKKLGQIITAEEINRRLNVKVVMEKTPLTPLSMFFDRELDITIDDESDKKRKLDDVIDDESEKKEKRQKKQQVIDKTVIHLHNDFAPFK